MRSGVAFPMGQPSFSGGSDPDFPASNLADLDEIRRVFKFGGGAIGFTLPAAMSVGLVAVVHHNAQPGATMTVTAGATSSGAISMNSPGIFPAVTPWCPATPVAGVTSGSVTLSSQSWVIGAIVVAGFWSFTDVHLDRQIGVEPRDAVTENLGADHATKMFGPRTLSASREVVDVRLETATAIDFVKASATPFVWVWDADDPSTWPNECWLARAVDPQPFRRLAHPQGRAAFQFVEHLG